MDGQNVFIAYHGTYDDFGSVGKAKELFYFLQSNGINCYFFPNEVNSYFADTPIIAQKADKFVFVCNPSVTVNSDGSIANNGVFQEITSFWNNIYEGKRQRGDARVYVYNGFTAREANRLHIAFQGVAHFDENKFDKDQCFEEVLNWVTGKTGEIEKQRADAKPAPQADNGISNELKKVFVRRSIMNKAWNLTQMVSVARKIECVGISNNEMTMNMDESVLRHALDNGTEIELLFLNPKSKYCRFRENEEKQEKNTIKNHTEASLSFIRRLKKSAAAGNYKNLRIYLYDAMPRMNMIFIDGEHLLLQYYANTVPGASNPCFYIKKLTDGQLFDFYYNQYTLIRNSSKGVE